MIDGPVLIGSTPQLVPASEYGLDAAVRELRHHSISAALVAARGVRHERANDSSAGLICTWRPAAWRSSAASKLWCAAPAAPDEWMARHDIARSYASSLRAIAEDIADGNAHVFAAVNETVRAYVVVNPQPPGGLVRGNACRI